MYSWRVLIKRNAADFCYFLQKKWFAFSYNGNVIHTTVYTFKDLSLSQSLQFPSLLRDTHLENANVRDDSTVFGCELFANEIGYSLTLYGCVRDLLFAKCSNAVNFDEHVHCALHMKISMWRGKWESISRNHAIYARWTAYTIRTIYFDLNYILGATGAATASVACIHNVQCETFTCRKSLIVVLVLIINTEIRFSF